MPAWIPRMRNPNRPPTAALKSALPEHIPKPNSTLLRLQMRKIRIDDTTRPAPGRKEKSRGRGFHAEFHVAPPPGGSHSPLLLRDVLRQNVPGITFGAGEGGSYGDSINIRGFTATNDVAVDGVRQSANTTHTDPFNTQAIEVVQGSSSVYSGVGALGGTINFVSKLPRQMIVSIAGAAAVVSTLIGASAIM